MCLTTSIILITLPFVYMCALFAYHLQFHTYKKIRISLSQNPPGSRRIFGLSERRIYTKCAGIPAHFEIRYSLLSFGWIVIF
eukprot:UN15883